MKLKLDGTAVSVTKLPGNLYALVLPQPKSEADEQTFKALWSKLMDKCGCAKTTILTVSEQQQFPAERTLVCTSDTYTHIIPHHFD